jgi:hypothetical protein
MSHDMFARILSLEVRHRSFGFAVLERIPRRLLDTGVRTYATAGTLKQRIEPLLSIFDPSVIVVKRPAYRNPDYLNGVQSILRVIRAEADRRSIPIESVTIHEVRCAFRESGETKDHIAMAISQSFPDLQWKLPPQRKPWISEGYNMVIFDATATGLTYLARSDLITKSK